MSGRSPPPPKRTKPNGNQTRLDFWWWYWIRSSNSSRYSSGWAIESKEKPLCYFCALLSMATANASTSAVMDASSAVVAVMDAPSAAAVAEEAAAKAAHKRFEGLKMVQTKAIKGKGAWYWAHLEPTLVRSSDTGLPKAVKLRCSLCDAVFSASNPSRTASEHLKRGTCPNFTSSALTAAGGGGVVTSSIPPISSIPPCSSSHRREHHHPAERKRHRPSYKSQALVFHSPPGGGDVVYSSSSTPPHPPPLPPPQQQVLSGGKDDLSAFAMLEDSVKKLKSPKASPGPALSKAQVDSALSLLSDWFYESCGAVSFSSVEHPRFRAFLHQVGLPAVSRRDLTGARLDARYEDARSDADARIRDALFFQVASDGWKSGGDAMVSLSVNLPTGSSLFRRAVFSPGHAHSKYAEEILWETVTDLCGTAVHRCAGLVADRFKSKALRNLENQNHWMVNLSCQLQGIHSLVKDFAHDLPFFRSVTTNCSKLATFFNTNSQIRNIFHKYQIQELDYAGLLRIPPSFDPCGRGSSHSGRAVNNYATIFGMLDDIVGSSRPIQLAVHDDSYKVISVEDPNARELGEMIRELGFWNDLDAVHSLVKLIHEMVQEMEAERPLVGQCLPLWNELRSKVKDWCAKFSIEEGAVQKVVEKRFKKNYHPAWSAAFILDPLYLMKDAGGKYLPPFKCLTPEQQKDVDKLIIRLVSKEEAHIALMELMKWRSEGLDPVYAQAVQVTQLDPMTGKTRVANPQGSRIMWETYLSEFKLLGKVASRLIFLHATSCGFKCNPSLLRWVCAHGRSRAGIDRAQKMVFVAAHAKLERRDFSNEEERDAELFANGEDDVLNEASFVDASSV